MAIESGGKNASEVVHGQIAGKPEKRWLDFCRVAWFRLNFLEPADWLRLQAKLTDTHFEARLWLSVTELISCP
jgi:hypothetical protein